MLADNMIICQIGNSDTIKYAGYELKKYLDKILRGRIQISLEERETYDKLQPNAIWLGLKSQLLPAESVENSPMDDSISISITGAAGMIGGSNERSVLLGAYRFLTELGCRWIRPGIHGEIIPAVNLADMNVAVDEKASYRHRGICIEGAASYENVADLIDWLPKVGFNSYFIQFREAYTFFERWYTHSKNPKLEPEKFSVERARQYVGDAIREIKKRGLIYHAVGHGWTCEAQGIPGLHWEPKAYDISPEIRQYLAQVNGKREIWRGIPLNTQLCYSNIEAREMITDNITKYLKKHGEIDLLHFWLADDSNNHCECDHCRQAYPSDFYVMLLNELDEKLTKEGIDTKIVFLVYEDLLWAPQKEKINNPDRFILMLAPLARSFSKEYSSKPTTEALPVYERNKLGRIRNVDTYVGLLRAWQKDFEGDSFDFNYHFMWEHYRDPGHFQISEVLSRDIQNLKDIGLNGLISCQTQRAFLPSGFGMHVMAGFLWNKNLDFNGFAKRYFRDAFGEDSEKCREYLSSLTELFDPMYMRREKTQVNPEAVEKFKKISPLVDSFLPVIERNTGLENKCRAQSWEYLKYHADICRFLAPVLEAWASDDKDEALIRLEVLKEKVQEIELDIQPVFDVWNFLRCMESRFRV